MIKTARSVRILAIVCVAVALNLVGHLIVQAFEFQIFPRHEPVLHAIVLSALGVYVLLMAIPFMPGIEIGLGLLLLLGGEGALLVYMSTVLALCLSFGAGRFMPGNTISGCLSWLHFRKAASLAKQFETEVPSRRLAMLYERLPGRLLPFILNNRFAAIALLLNLPGNALVGGGGGIGMVLGMSRLIPFYQYALTVALAVAPVPLFVYLIGS